MVRASSESLACRGLIIYPICITLYIRVIDLTNTLQIFNYKYKFLITNMLIIIIDLLVYNYYYLYYIKDSIHLQLSMKI